MEKPLLIIIILLCSFIAKAQNRPIVSSSKIDTSILVDPIEYIPQFPGGQKAWNKFLTKNLKWPNGVDGQGKVIIQFTVEKTGSLTGISVIKKLSPEFDAEALRVVKLSPHWIPAKKNGKPIRQKFYIPIIFQMPD